MTSCSNALFLVLGGLLSATTIAAFGVLGYVAFSDIAVADAQMVFEPRVALTSN